MKFVYPVERGKKCLDPRFLFTSEKCFLQDKGPSQRSEQGSINCGANAAAAADLLKTFCVCFSEIKCSLMKTLSFMRLKQKSVLFGDTAILYQAPPFRVAGKYLDSGLIRPLKGPVWYR